METDEKICHRSAKCPIYSGVLDSKGVLIKTYKNLYCENGKAGHEKCKRYQVAMIAGSSPPDLLPNSSLPVEEIVMRMGKSQ